MDSNEFLSGSRDVMNRASHGRRRAATKLRAAAFASLSGVGLSLLLGACGADSPADGADDSARGAAGSGAASSSSGGGAKPSGGSTNVSAGTSNSSVDLRGAPEFYSEGFTDPRGPGYPCALDSDCDSGTCVAYGDGDPSYKYCTMACSTNDDCEALLDNSIVVRVPLQYEAFSGVITNNWNTEVLFQAPYCHRDTKLCAFVCPMFSAAKFDASGALTSCSCLTGFTKGGDAPQHCVWDETLGCSFVTDPSGESVHVCDEEKAKGGLDICPDVAEPTCAMYDDGTFEGACLWWTSDINACVGSAPANCNDSCLEQCYFITGSSSCYDLCCQSGGSGGGGGSGSGGGGGGGGGGRGDDGGGD